MHIIKKGYGEVEVVYIMYSVVRSGDNLCEKLKGCGLRWRLLPISQDDQSKHHLQPPDAEYCQPYLYSPHITREIRN